MKKIKFKKMKDPSTMLALALALALALMARPVAPDAGKSNGHEDNWAIIVDTSRFWYNYRHGANALTVYHNVKVSFYPTPLLWQGASSSS